MKSTSQKFKAFLAFLSISLSTSLHAQIVTEGVFTTPILGVVSGVGTSRFAYGVGEPTTVQFTGVVREGALPRGPFKVGTITLFNGGIAEGTGAIGVNLDIFASDATKSGPIQEDIVVPALNGSVLRLKEDLLQQVEARFQALSLGPDDSPIPLPCGVSGTFAGEAWGEFLAPPLIWSSWFDIGPAVSGGAQLFEFRPGLSCGDGPNAVIGQVRYVPENKAASGTAFLGFVNTPNTGDPIADADSFCATFDVTNKCAWVPEGQSASFTLLGRLGSLEFVDIVPTPGDGGFVTVGFDPTSSRILPAIIDLKPGSESNSVNPNAAGVIPVAILSNDSFDATQVDVSTLAFAPGEAKEMHGRGHVEDIDGDGDFDVVLHFKTRGSGIQCGDLLVTLTGSTFDDNAFAATDSIETVSCAE